MARRSTRHNPKQLIIPNFNYFDGGLELSKPAWKLEDNQIVDGTNFYYDNDTGKMTTRPGLVSFRDLGGQVASMEVANVAGSRYLMLAYKLEGADSMRIAAHKFDDSSLVEINTFSPWSGSYEGRRPVFENFIETAGQEAAYWAMGDGVSRLYVWDGSGAGVEVADSPVGSDIVIGKSGRLFVDGGVGEEDLMKASGILDETQWDYPFGLFAQIGWPDGDTIKAVGVLGDDLVAFKGDVHKRIVKLQGVYPEWKLAEVARGTSVVNQFCIVRVGRDLVLLDSDGVNSLSGVVEYGDLKVDPVGSAVSGPLTSQLNSTAFVVPWPKQSIVLFFPYAGPLCYVLHYRRGPQGLTTRWTSFLFNEEITCGTYDYSTNLLYLGTKSGVICTMEREPIFDTTYTDLGASYPQSIRSKIVQDMEFGGEVFLKRLVFDYTPLLLGSGVINANVDEGTRSREVATFNITPDTIDLDDNVTIDEDVGPIGLVEGADTRSTQRVRARDIQIGITVESGAIEVDSVYAELAIVGRR